MAIKIFWSFLIAFGIVVVSVILGYVIISCTSLESLLTDESARYVFSAVAQSLAAIFALTFVVTSWITSLTAKDMAKYVFEYIFRLISTWVTIWLFIFSIGFNFIYLGFTDKSIIGSHNLLHYSYGFFASILLFVISVFYLMHYAAMTYRVSVAPFNYFYELIKQSISPSLKSLKEFLSNRLSFDELLNTRELSYSLEWVCEGKMLVKYEGKEGYLSAYDPVAVRMAGSVLQDKPGIDTTIYYLVGMGDNIQKGKAIFAFDALDFENNNRIISILKKAVTIKKYRPGWVAGFSFLGPLFEIVKYQHMEIRELDNSIRKLFELGEYYLLKRADIVRPFDRDLKGFNYYEFLDYWFDEYHGLIKKACIATRQMREEGEILENEDEPDFYVSAGLHKFVSLLYRENQEIYFKKALNNIYKYSKFKADIESKSTEREYVSQLQYVVKSISHITREELKGSKSLTKFETYFDILFYEYSNMLKDETSFSEHAPYIGKTHNFLKRYLVENIENELRDIMGEVPIGILDGIKVKLMSMLFILTVYAFGKWFGKNYVSNLFTDMFNVFRNKYIRMHNISNEYGHGYVNPREMFKEARKTLDKLHWFMNVIDEEDLYDDERGVLDSRVRTDEYCYFVYFIMLMTKTFVIPDKSFWLLDDLSTSRHYYGMFKEEVNKSTSKMSPILSDLLTKLQLNLNQRLEDLDQLFGENNAG